MKRFIKKIKKTLGLDRDRSVCPIEGYPSSVIDSKGCEFGFEMYYHIGYAYHLHRRGLLTKTISTRDTQCFYWFSPEHEERYTKRQWVADYPTIAQVPHEAPDFARWEIPDFAGRYAELADFGFDKPTVAVFNKYNVEWFGPPINFLAKQPLLDFAARVRDDYQLVYFRPTSHIILDDCELIDLEEKSELKGLGAVLAEDLYERHSELTFNTFQLAVLAQCKHRAVVQGGAAYLNALFPGQVHILHRHGDEARHGTYENLRRMTDNRIEVFADDARLLSDLADKLKQQPSHRAA